MDKYITPNELDSYKFSESTPNDCGAFSDVVYISCIEDSKRYLRIGIVLYKGRYLVGHNASTSTGGSFHGAYAKSKKSYETPREAFYAELDSYATLNMGWLGDMCREAKKKYGNVQLSLFDS